jgi:hypothetical protein
MDAPGFKAGPCPFESNGELRVWLTRRGRLALICDECDCTWFDRDNISLENAQHPYPEGWAPPDRSTPGRRFVSWLRAWGFIPTRRPDFVFPDGDALDRPATAEEIRAAGWGDLVPGS